MTTQERVKRLEPIIRAHYNAIDKAGRAAAQEGEGSPQELLRAARNNLPNFDLIAEAMTAFETSGALPKIMEASAAGIVTGEEPYLVLHAVLMASFAVGVETGRSLGDIQRLEVMTDGKTQ